MKYRHIETSEPFGNGLDNVASGSARSTNARDVTVQYLSLLGSKALPYRI